jgi:hypothetical protein
MRPIQRRSLCFGALIAMLVTACVPAVEVTSSWKDPSYRGYPNKILVIGVAKKPTMRRMFEDEFVRQLTGLGMEAVASYTVIPDAQQDNQEAIAAKLKELSADTVLITRVTDKKTVTTYVPGTVYNPPAYYGTWNGYYRQSYQTVYTPGQTIEDQYAMVETNLYDAVTDELIWSASSEVSMQHSADKLITSFVNAMVGAMADKKLLR